jgi:hypothetical protein
VDAPEVVDEDVEDTQYDDKEHAGPLCLETNCNHSACTNSNERYKGTRNAPLATESEANEQEDQQDTAREEEAKRERATSETLENLYS